jgi:U3 small nucleolar RNA-associated protein 6
MADGVQYILDRMSVVFAMMRDVDLFNELEIKSIVKKRTDFEYLMRRRELHVNELMPYINYEKKLNELRGIL